MDTEESKWHEFGQEPVELAVDPSSVEEKILRFGQKPKTTDKNLEANQMLEQSMQNLIVVDKFVSSDDNPDIDTDILIAIEDIAGQIRTHLRRRRRGSRTRFINDDQEEEVAEVRTPFPGIIRAIDDQSQGFITSYSDSNGTTTTTPRGDHWTHLANTNSAPVHLGGGIIGNGIAETAHNPPTSNTAERHTLRNVLRVESADRPDNG